MTDIYKQHKTAFKNVAGYIVTHNGEHVATIAFKYPKDGSGRLYTYVHWLGRPMVRGYAAGGGYDKKTAACSSAVSSKAFYNAIPLPSRAGEPLWDFYTALKKDGGPTWDSALRAAGFDVLHAV